MVRWWSNRVGSKTRLCCLLLFYAKLLRRSSLSEAKEWHLSYESTNSWAIFTVGLGYKFDSNKRGLNSGLKSHLEIKRRGGNVRTHQLTVPGSFWQLSKPNISKSVKNKVAKQFSWKLWLRCRVQQRGADLLQLPGPDRGLEVHHGRGDLRRTDPLQRTLERVLQENHRSDLTTMLN